MSETRLNDRNLSYCRFPGYTLFYNNSATKAGGPAIYVSDNIKFTQLSKINLNVMDVKMLELNFNIKL